MKVFLLLLHSNKTGKICSYPAGSVGRYISRNSPLLSFCLLSVKILGMWSMIGFPVQIGNLVMLVRAKLKGPSLPYYHRCFIVLSMVEELKIFIP
jgi:hypothetical protein